MSALGVSELATIGEALVSIAPLPYIVADDVSWRVVLANAHAEALYGGPLAGVALESLLTLGAERAVEGTIWRAQTSDEPVELFFERQDGSSAEVLVRAHRLDLNGCTASLIVLEDVSRVRLLARSLAHAATERRDLFDALGLGVVEIDSTGRILAHNGFGPIETLFPSGLAGRNFFRDVAVGSGPVEVLRQYELWTSAIIDAPFRAPFEFELGRHFIEAEMLAGSFTTCDAIVRLSDATLRRQAEAELRQQTAQAEEAARRSRLVYQTTSLLHQTLDLDTVLATAVEETGRLLGACCCQIAFVDSLGDVRIAHEYLRSPREVTQGLVAAFDLLPATAEAVRTLLPVVVELSNAAAFQSDSGMRGRSGAASAIVVPIAVRREPCGVLAILQSDKTRSWTEADIELGVSVAAQVGLAIGHSEIHERLRLQAERDAMVGRFAVAIHAAPSLDEALRRAAELLLTQTECDGVSVRCRDPRLSRDRTWCWDVAPDGAVRSVDPAVCELADRTRRVLDGEAADDEPTIAFSPFTSRDGVLGLLAIRFRRSIGSTDVQALVDAVAVHVGIAVGASTLLSTVTEAQKVWEGAFDALPDGVVVVDRSMSVIRSNRALASQLRAKPSTMIGQRLPGFFSDTMADAIANAVGLVDSGRKPVQVEVEDSSLCKWFALSASRLPMSDQDAFILSIRDVTRERTISENLAQSTRLASIGRLAAGVAHEINTPLATIAGSAQSLDRQLSSIAELQESERWQSIRERIDAIVEQAFRCKRITRDLLDYAAPTRPKFQECSIAAVVETSIDTIARERGTERITVTEKGTAAPVFTDPERVAQVLINLVANGLDAIAEKPKGRLSVEIRHLLREVRLAVRDTGPGISPADRERIFEPFFTTKPPGRGTGLGLSISMSIVSRLGGRLEAKSSPGRGSTFTVTLRRNRPGEESG